MKFIKTLFLFVCVLALTSGSSRASAQMSFFDFLKNQDAGKPATDFTLKNLKGEDVNMTKVRDGKKAIIFFWATWCPHCRVALSELNNQKEAIMAKGIKLIIVDSGEEATEVMAHVKSHKVDLDILLDTDNAVAEKYNLVGVPTFIFINQDGLVQEIGHSLPKNYDEILSRSKKK